MDVHSIALDRLSRQRQDGCRSGAGCAPRPTGSTPASKWSSRRKSIAAIFADDGETHFRDLEAIVVDLLALRERTVIAAGGGAILREVNRQAIDAAAPSSAQASVDTL